MVLCKLLEPGRPTYLDKSRARVNCACSRCRWGLFAHFFRLIYHLSLLSPSLRETEKQSQRAVKPKTTNQSIEGNKKGFSLLFHYFFFSFEHEHSLSSDTACTDLMSAIVKSFTHQNAQLSILLIAHMVKIQCTVIVSY